MSRKNIVIAPVGDNIQALYLGIKEFPTEKIFLLTPEEYKEAALKAKKDIQRFNIPVEIMHIGQESLMEEIFRLVAEIKKREKDKSIIVNIATGSKMSTCIALSAAFVNGLKAFGVDNNQPMLMPILKFSYYKLLTERKTAILKILEDRDKVALDEISRRTGMSLPLISYHIHGTYKVEGLKELGLIETSDKRGRVEVRLSTLGKLLVKGYV